MRDILNDLEAGKQLSDPDPVRRAQIQMKAPVAKRFYEARDGRASRRKGFPCGSTASAVKTPAGSAGRPADRSGGGRSWRPSLPPRAKRSIRSPCRSRASSTRRSTASPPTRRRCSRTSCGSRRPTSSATAPMARDALVRPPGRGLGPDHRLGALGARRALLPGRGRHACRAAARGDRARSASTCASAPNRSGSPRCM